MKKLCQEVNILIRKIDNIYMKRFMYFNLYVIKGKDGDILIDTGFILQKKQIKKWLDNFNIKLIILTHAHLDHIWNAAYFQKIYNCDIAMSKNDIEFLDNSKINSKSLYRFFIPFTKLMNLAMKTMNQNEFKVDIKLYNNQVLDKYDNKINIIDLPGHTNGSIGIVYKDYLFAGDAAVNRRRFAEPAYQNQDNKAAIYSMVKMIKLKPKIIFVGHDKPITQEKLIKSEMKINKFINGKYKRILNNN